MTSKNSITEESINTLQKTFECKKGDSVGLIDTEEVSVDAQKQMRFLRDVLKTEIEKKRNEALQPTSFLTDEKCQ